MDGHDNVYARVPTMKKSFFSSHRYLFFGQFFEIFFVLYSLGNP